MIVNSTVCGNHSGKGGGIAVYGKAAKPSKGGDRQLYDCRQHDGDGRKRRGIAAGCRRRGYRGLHNTLISGNTTDGAADDVAWFKDASYKVANSIIGGTVYNADGMVVAGEAFDPASMLSPLGDNGGATKTCVLLGDANPARQYGMSASELKIPGRDARSGLRRGGRAIDQTGASRTARR